LAPGIEKLLGQLGWQAADIDLVAVATGPGSFTGLRVGVTTAKALAYAASADILGVDTLRAIAAAAPEDVETLSVAVDAQRGEVVAGMFRRGDDGAFEPDGKAELLAADDWLAGLADGTAIAGPVLRKLAGRVSERLVVLPEQTWPPKASNVARLARRDYLAGRRDDVWKLVPRYSRRSAAEEKWERQHRSPK
jgi:tRNA threonylcarbamoyladenosine biosynthesis protein TsaB